MDLREFRDTLLRLERPGEVLLLADKYLAQMWKLRKDPMLATAAKLTHTGRVSAAERAQMSKEFWQRIDEEIDNGEVPKP